MMRDLVDICPDAESWIGHGYDRETERIAIAAEITELENLLATIPEGNVIERMSLESRLESVRADLADALRGEK